MEPIGSDGEDFVLQLENMSLEATRAASRTLNGREVSHTNVSNVNNWLEDSGLPSASNNNNDNNTRLASPRQISSIQLEILSAGSISYEACVAAIQKHARLVFTEQGFSILDNYLTSIDMLAAPVRPKDAAAAYAFLAAITQVGNTFDGFCSIKERLVGRALDLELPMLVEILTIQEMSKETLSLIAGRHEDKELETWLQQAILKELAHFRSEIQKDPQDVFEKTSAFFVRHTESFTFRTSSDGNTLLHEAFLAYINDQAIGAIEFAVLLGLGMKKDLRNVANISVEDLARNSELGIFTKLIEHEAPTKAILLDIVLQELIEAPEDPHLQLLSDWLTQ